MREAERYLQAAAQCSRHHFPSQFNLSLLRLEKGELLEAAEYYKAAQDLGGAEASDELLALGADLKRKEPDLIDTPRAARSRRGANVAEAVRRAKLELLGVFGNAQDGFTADELDGVLRDEAAGPQGGAQPADPAGVEGAPAPASRTDLPPRDHGVGAGDAQIDGSARGTARGGGGPSRL